MLTRCSLQGNKKYKKQKKKTDSARVMENKTLRWKSYILKLRWYKLNLCRQYTFEKLILFVILKYKSFHESSYSIREKIYSETWFNEHLLK